MRQKTLLSSLLAPISTRVALCFAGAGVGLLACSGEFKTTCPEGTTQTAGGGDINEACRPNYVAGNGGTGGAGAGGEPPLTGNGGVGSGGRQPNPPEGECVPATTRCTFEAVETCESDGHWGVPVTCAIACDATGVACVAPVQLAVGRYGACVRMSDQTVRCWSDGKYGELGNGSATGSTVARKVSDLQGVKDLVNAGETLCALLVDKTAVCWGSNDGKIITTSPAKLLSTSQGEVAPYPTLLEGVSNAKQIAAHNGHLCILSEDGEVECRGDNLLGQLGNGTNLGSSSFVKVSGFVSTPRQLTSGFSFKTCAVMDNGHVSCWGAGSRGGNGSSESTNLLAPTLVAGVDGIRAVADAIQTSCALRQDGKLLCWGDNRAGQLGRVTVGPEEEGLGPGLVNQLDNVIQISTGYGHVCAVKADQSLWCWGASAQGALGLLCEASNPICKPSATPLSDFAVPSPFQTSLRNVVEVGAGENFTCARTADARIHCWGENRFGQLGNGTIGDPVIVPTPVVWKLGLFWAASS